LAEVINNKKDKKPEATAEMSFWEHIEALRWHLIRSVAAIVVFGLIAFMNRHFIFDEVLLSPISSDFITTRWLCVLADWVGAPSLCLDNSKLRVINISMSGQFMTHMYISFMSGLVVAFPYVIWEIWRFIKPALRPQERRYSGAAVTVISVLFLGGVLFSYYLIVPMTVNFLGTYQVSESVENQVSLNSYISTVVSLSFSMGIVFELPVLVFFLAKVGIISAALMKQYRKFMIVVIFIIAAIITPPDAFSQMMVAIPLLLLYEISIVVARKAGKNTSQA
jgi:sec-independent protein translocase protein TatC